MDDIYKSIEEYNPSKKHGILILFDDMIAHMLSNKILSPIVLNIYYREKSKHFSYFCYTILFSCAKIKTC